MTLPYAIIIAFVTATGHGEGAGDDRFSSFEACEKARPAVVETFKAEMQFMHGVAVTVVSSHCGLASELGATPI